MTEMLMHMLGRERWRALCGDPSGPKVGWLGSVTCGACLFILEETTDGS